VPASWPLLFAKKPPQPLILRLGNTAVDRQHQDHRLHTEQDPHRPPDHTEALAHRAPSVTFSASHSATHPDTVMDTGGTFQFPGGSGIPAASDTTRAMDSVSTVWGEEMAVWEEDMEAAAVDMVEAAEVINSTNLSEDLSRSNFSPDPALANKSDKLLFSLEFLLPFSVCAGHGFELVVTNNKCH
jgi:hypothetical protein